MPGNGKPYQLIDLIAAKDDMMNQARGLHPSLAFLLGSGITPAAETGIDPRRLPFADVSPQLREQRQHQLLNPVQNTPFSLAGAANQLRANKNTRK